MPNSYKEILEDLEFAWVEVPPALPKKLYWGHEAWHERRKAAHTSSFMALGLLVNPIGETEITDRFLRHFMTPQMAKSLKEQNYHLLHESQKICSRSHTDKWACALVSSQDPNCASIGVDIESRQREVKAGIQRFFVHKDDQTKNLQDIEIWCLKEATFKCLSSYMNFHQIVHPTLVLTDICLQQLDEGKLVFSYQNYRGSCAILPGQNGPRELITAWALLRV